MERRSLRCLLTLGRDNPIVDDHRVHGVRTLPGVTFLDVVCRLLAARDVPLEGAELTDVLFVEPVVTTESFDRELAVDLRPDGDVFHVTATSRRTHEGTPLDDVVTTHLRGVLRIGVPSTGTPEPVAPGGSPEPVAPGGSPEPVAPGGSPEPVASGGPRSVDEVYAAGRSAGIEHRAFMRCLGTLRTTPDRVRAELTLGDEARATATDFLLHPALLDGSTMQAYALVFGGADADPRPLIPLHVAAFRALRPLGDGCAVDLRLSPTRPGPDVVKADIDLYDRSGSLAAQFVGLTLKRVRSTSAFTRLTTTPPTAGPPAPLPASGLPVDAPPASAPAVAMPAADAPPVVAVAVPTAGAGLPAAERDPVDLRAEIVDLVRQAVGDPGLPVEADRGFYDLGLESGHLLSLVRAIEERWDVTLYPTLLFEYPTVDAVAAHLAGLLPEDRRTPAARLRETGPAPTDEVSREPAPTDEVSRESALAGEVPTGGVRTAAVPAGEVPARTHCLTGVWQPAPRPAAPSIDRLLVIGDLRMSAGQVTAHRGPAFRRLDHRTYQLRPESRDDLRALLADLDAAPGAILHVAEPARPDLPRAVESACAEVLALAQVLAQTRAGRPAPVVHLGPTPVAAAVAGLARTVRLEQPRLVVTAVECDDEPDPDALLAEFADDREVRVRHVRGRRYVRRYRDLDLPDRTPPRLDGVHLVTGGAGGIGRALARWLRDRGATVVLAGRTAPDEPLDVEFRRADVTVRSEVDALVAGVLARHGRLDGVVHAAGVLRDGLLPGKSGADLAAVLAPKVRGTVLLDEATRHLNLDHFVVFSSLTGVVGNVGQADYAAANAFLDAYAHERGFTSVAWPLWADGGMRTDPGTEAVFRRQGQVPLPTAAGLAVFERVVGLPGTEVVVLHGDPDRARVSLDLQPAADPEAADVVAVGGHVPVADLAVVDGGVRVADVAVVGVAGRYPMADDLDGFWANLRSGRDCVTEIPPDRWSLAGFYEPDRSPGRSYSKWGAFLDGIDEFDPGFFRITPREAAAMDPQERLFLQTAWHALEDAGLTRADVAGRQVGVFAGVMFTQYQLLGLGAEERLPVLPTSFTSAVANRLSYFLDLRGPSLALDTMCSSSLTALHLACESLRSGECELAFAGGVNVIVHPYKYLHLSQVGFVSSDGRCRSFGAGGDGYVPGEGVGVVVLKPLARALADGDRVLAVIKGSAVNHGGRASGFYVPNPVAQADVVRRALRRADVDPATVGYVEAHGTGTALGDPVEISALGRVFGATACRLGSVKSGIGHLESAAGVAGLTKVLLQLRHRTLVPSLHAEPANEGIDWDATGLRVQRDLVPWPTEPGTPRRAGISAFGAGGANAHVVVEEFPEPPVPEQPVTGPQVVLLSARTVAALRILAERYLELDPVASDQVVRVAELAGLADADPDAELDELGLDADDLRRLARALAERFPGRTPHVDARSTLSGLAAALPAQRGSGVALADLAYTTQVGREAMAERLALVVTEPDALRSALRAFLAGSVVDGYRGTVTGRTTVAVPDSADPHVLARAWAAGAAPHWRALHIGRRPRKVALPNYPFARVRCWVDTSPAVSMPDSVSPVGCVGSAEWASSGSDSAPPSEAGGRVQPGTGAVAAGPGGAGGEAPPLEVPVWEVHQPSAELPTPAGPVVVLHPPGHAALAGELAARHEGALLAEVGAAVTGTPRLVYLLVGATGTAGNEADRVARAEAAGVRMLLRYARQWAHLPVLDWVVVTAGATAAPGRNLTDPYVAGVVGFARVLENEHPGWSVTTVDLDPEHLSAVPVTVGPRGTRVAYTGTRSHRQVLRPAPDAPGAAPLRRGGRYLIVGGAGGIGSALARRLVDDWDAEVVLVGRRVRADVEPGGRIRYLRADATDPRQLGAVLDRAGPVHGVVHAAMVQRDRLVRNLSDAELGESLAAKSGVAATLVDVLDGRPLDFLVFFSSAQSFLGDAGLANYAAGSTFLDAYAHALDGRLPYPVRAINWGFWGTVGSVADEAYRERLTAAGFRSITPEAGFAGFLAALRQPAPQMVVVPGTAELRGRMGAAGTREPAPDGGLLSAAELDVVADFDALNGELTKIAREALLALLDGMGAWDGPAPDADEIARRIAVVPRYDRLLRTLTTMLAEAGLLAVRGGRYRPTPAALAAARAGGHVRRLGELAEAHPPSAVFARLLALCLDRYPELLRGDLLATDLLFPASGTSLMEAVYRGNPVSDLYNDLLTARLVGHVQRRLAELPAGERIRVLEVGSGTGGTSAGLLRALSPYAEHVDYWYTDLSVAFLAHGRREFGTRYPFVRFKRLDLDTDLVAQGFPADGFDLAVGANVLHATSDVGRAVRHLRAVLRSGGQLLLNELTTVTLPATVTYGLFDGWWAHADPDLRLPGSPLLDVAGWTALLGRSGYGPVVAIPDPAETTRNFQHVVVATAGRPGPSGSDVGVPFTDEILELTAEASGIPRAELDLDREIGEYGFDSVSYSLLAARLNDEFGFDVTPTLFYETATLRVLVDRLAADHADLLATRYAAGPGHVPPRPSQTPVPPVASSVPSVASSVSPPVPSLPSLPPSVASELLAPSQSTTTVTPGRPGSAVDEPIAVIGMAGRMPGSRDLDEFWTHLLAGTDLVTDVPPDRWDWRCLPEDVHARRGGFVDDVDLFDPLFFGISPHEAAGMDPQQRLVLQGVWTALEDAGLAPGTLAGSDVGLFVGVGSSDYDEVRRAAGTPVDAHAATATTHSILVNRVSYLLDLHGPSEPVNTGCSSSLVALHRAAESIRSGECEVAVAGGVNLVLSPQNHVLLSRTGMLSASGRCHAFDAAADGFVRGEGLGLVVLTGARRARHHRVRAWLRGTAVNHGGRARSLTAPNPVAQAAMIVRAHERAGGDPTMVGYLETHGTGTELGDPVEVNGLRMAFDELLRRRGAPPPVEPFCALGAVKANIGHLESAAGIAGVLKVLLAMEHGVLPPLAGLREPNPHLRLDDGPFRLVRTAQPWPRPTSGPRRAGVSSFGYGGVNAHVVLEEATQAPAPTRSAGPWVFPLSARTPEALRRYAAALRAFVERAPDRPAADPPDLADVAYTLQHGRDVMDERLAVTAGDRRTLVAALTAFGDGADHPALARPDGPALADRWVAGARVDWPSSGVLVPLPTYPFERRRCWVDPQPTGAAGPVGAVRTYAPGWQQVDDLTNGGPVPGPVWLLGGDGFPSAQVHRVSGVPLTSLPTPATVHAVVTGGEAAVLDLFRIVEHLQSRPAAAGELSLTVVTRNAVAVDGPVTDPLCAAVRGLVMSVRRECERWRVSSVDVGAGDPTTLRTSVPGDFAYRAGRWYRQVLRPLDDAAPVVPVLRDSGTYVLVGGTGDVGLDIAGHLVRRHRARVVLVGRSRPDASRAERIRRLDPSGSLVQVRQADATDAAQLRAVFDQVGEVHGVLHSVTVPCDRSLAAMDEAWFARGMAAKTRTTLALAEALAGRRLDFLAIFSSVQSFLGNPGQAAYAAGCTGQDAIGAALADRLPYPVRVLNWGAWAGSALTERHRDRLAAAGVHPLAPEAGFEALSRVLGRQEVHVAVVSGTDDFLGTLGVPATGVPTAGVPVTGVPVTGVPVTGVPAAGVPVTGASAAGADERWRDGVTAELLALVREVAGVSPAELGPDDQLARYGFDSIVYTRLSHRVNARWDLDLTPASFFGVATARELVSKIIREGGARLAANVARTEPPLPGQAASTVPATPAPVPAHATSVPPAAPAAPATSAYARSAPPVAPAAPAAPAASATPAYATSVLPAAPAVGLPPAPGATTVVEPSGYAAGPDAVAIVGMAGVLPGSADLDEFWAHLVAGDDLVTEIPPDRWDWRRIHGEPEPGQFRTTARWGGFLHRVDLFDPEFFGISATEAVAMDPQHRLVLEATWTAIENGGIRPSALAGTDTGVFVGSGTYDYFELQHALGVPLDGYNTVGRAHAIMSNRISYLLDLHGPSETIDTACSSSLVAVHRAAEAIRHGDCRIALAGGVNVIASPTLFVDMSQADMLSPDGRCRTFDARANGIARAEGVGMVLLKRLDAAIADGDVIHAVLRASAVNHGGRTNSLTAPNPDAQAACIVRAHRAAGVDPRTVSYVETHGTGTELGDPIEVEGLKTAFAQLYADHGATCVEPHVALGAVKTNTGHLEAAAGVTGLLKVLLAMRHRELPGTVHLDTLNPHLRLDGTPLRVLRDREPWRRLRTPEGTEAPLRAGVSSFGLGGVNAHVVVEEYPTGPAADHVGPYLFVLSARDADRLRSSAERLARWLRDGAGVDPAALAYTLQTGRDERAERLAVVAADTRALAGSLTAWLDGTDPPGVFVGDGRDGTTALLLDGAEGRQYLRAVVGSGRLDKLARLWVGGAPIDWADLWPGPPPRRVPAPTYPFARQSYWLTPGAPFDRVQAVGSGLVAPVDDELPEAVDRPAGPGVPADPERPAAPGRPVDPGQPVDPEQPVGPDRAVAGSVPAEPVAPTRPVPGAPEGGDAEAVVREHVRALLAAHLGTPPERLPVDRVLSDAGVDSLGLRRLSRRLGADYGVTMPARMFGVGQTVRAVARAVVEAYGPLPVRMGDGEPARNGTGAVPDGIDPPEPEPDGVSLSAPAANGSGASRPAGNGSGASGPAANGLGALLAGLRDGTVRVDDALAQLQRQAER